MAIKYLCDLPIEELEQLGYAPFSLVKEYQNDVEEKRIVELLKNENNQFFKGDIPEQFTTILVNNENFADGIRNCAFHIGYM